MKSATPGVSDGDRYSELFELATVGNVVTDGSGEIVEANETAGQLLGLSARQLVGTPIASFVAAENREQFGKTLEGLARQTLPAEWELELRGQDGRRFHAQLNTTPSSDGGLRWMIQDITERLATEERLRSMASALEERVHQRTDELEQERAKLEAIVDQMPGGVVVAEAPGGRVLTVNEQARDMLGLDGADDVLGRSVEEDTPLARALRGEAVSRERFEYESPDRSSVVLIVTASPIRDSSGRITAAVAIFEDITAREVREKAELDFVMNAAHELQTPLAAIRSAVEVLQAGAKNVAERDLFIGHIERESERLERLTRALLTLARARTEFEDPRSELIELCPMLEAIAERMEPEEGVSLSVECAGDLALVSNQELLVQAVSNVVRNSVKYTQAGSIRLRAVASGTHVEIIVSDTGSGISPDVLPLVAERFYQGDVTRDGFGLGLAIVESAVEVLGGTLEIASAGSGRGTTVTISLPVGATMVDQ